MDAVFSPVHGVIFGLLSFVVAAMLGAVAAVVASSTVGRLAARVVEPGVP